MTRESLTSDARIRLILIAGCYGAVWGIAEHLDFALVWLPAGVFQSLVLCGLLSVVHECTHAHRGLFGNPAINAWVGRLAATLLGLNYVLYRHLHMRHHRFLNTPNDPEPAIGLKTPVDYLRYLLSNPHFCLMSRQFVESILGHWDDPAFRGIDERLRDDIRRDSYLLVGWILIVAALTVFAPTKMATLYLVPLAGSLVLDGIISLPEHYGLRGERDNNAGSRTVISNAFVRFLLWNVNYHVEHHERPGARFYELPRVHSKNRGGDAYIDPSYFGFHWKLLRQLYKRGTVAVG